MPKALRCPGIAWLVIIAVSYMSCGSGPGATEDTGATLSFKNGVSPDSSYAGTSDTYMSYYLPTDTFPGSGKQLSAGYDGVPGRERALIKFDMSGKIPQGAVITGVDLTLYLRYCAAASNFRLYKVTKEWTESACWSYCSGTMPWTAAGGDFEATPISDSVAMNAGTDVGYRMFSIDTSVVQEWFGNPAQNHGVILISDNETTNSYAEWPSSESDSASRRPMLTVRYILP